MQTKLILILLSALLFSACSAKHQGQYDEFFNNQIGWIPVNTQNKDLNEGSKDEK